MLTTLPISAAEATPHRQNLPLLCRRRGVPNSPQSSPVGTIIDWANYFDCRESPGRDDFSDMASPLSQLQVLPQLMHAAEVRHRVISQNIANVNTPGYQALEVEFEAELTRRLRKGEVGAGPLPEPEVRHQQGLPERGDGNNVDIDREIGRLNKNALLYQTYSQTLAAYLDSLRRAMRTP